MKQKQLKKIQINGVTFYLDHQYDFVMDLVSDRFKKACVMLDQLFGRDNKAFLALIDAILHDGCEDDVAMTYFLSMGLQNMGQFEKAGKIISSMYAKHSSDLLAKCAYANHLLFQHAVDGIPKVFGNTFDLEKVCTQREFPLVVFVQFMSIAHTYYLFKNDVPNAIQYLKYLMDFAPEHEETQGLIKVIMQERSVARA